MPLIIKDNSIGDFKPMPEGMHHGVCYAVIDLGTQPTTGTTNWPARRKVAITWEIPAERITVDGKSLPRAITGIWTMSLNAKGNLRRILESWRGRKFTPDELDGFDLENLIGTNALLNLVHNKVGDKTFTNIVAVSPLVKGTLKLPMENPRIFFQMPDDPKEDLIPNDIPSWIKAKIMASEEFAKSASPHHQPTEAQMANQGDGEDEEVPF